MIVSNIRCQKIDFCTQAMISAHLASTGQLGIDICVRYNYGLSDASPGMSC